MSFIDAFVAPAPSGNREGYKAYAAKFDAMFKAHGATRIVESWESDVPEGKLTSLPLAVKREAGESIILGFIEWPSKAKRDEAWEKLRRDPAMQDMSNMPFDGKRMIYGGFDVILEM